MKKKKKVQNHKFNLIDEYKKCLIYLRESKNFIYITLGIFFLFVFIGFFLPTPEPIYTQLIDFMKKLLNETQDMSYFELIKFIIGNNVQSTFFVITGGFFIGVFPIVNAVVNGYLIGFVSSLSVNAEGILSLWKILPHGIFELPAVFISLGIGLKFGTFIFQKKKLDSFKNYLLNSIRIFLLIVIPLLIIAGIIEGSLIYLLK